MCFLDIDIILDEGGKSRITKHNKEGDEESECKDRLKFDNQF